MKKGSQRGRGRIFKRPDSPLWWIAYMVDRLDGKGNLIRKEKRESTGSPKHAEAIALLDQRVRERKEEKLIENPNVTVRELLEDLVAHYEVRRLASARTVRTHLDAFCDLTRNKAGEIVAQGPNGIGHIRAAKLGAHVDGLLTRWQAADDAVATINRRLSSLTQAYRLAAACRPPKVAHVPTFPKLDGERVREGFFGRQDFLAVLDHLRDADLRDFCQWAYLTGMRKGAIAGLTWDAIDLETWTLVLPARLAKNRRPLRLPLKGAFRAVIERRLLARRPDCRLVFHRDGERCYQFRKAWASACKAAGVTGRLFHDLRRTGVRNLIRAGVHRRVAMRISGHATESIFARYDIDTDEDLQDAVQKLTAYIEEARP